MKILVCGASGFIGKNMAAHFSNLGHEVTRHGFTRAEYSYPIEPWIKADLREPLDFTGYDVVIQAAATTSGSKDIVNTPAIHVTDNAIMNSLIFRAATEAKVKHLIFFSCTVMYGSSDKLQAEDAPIDIHPKYFGIAHTKLYCERMCEFYARTSSTKFTVIRHSNIYGTYDKYDLEKSHFFGSTVTKVMQANDSITLWGNGQEARDLLHVNDLCNFVELAIINQKEKFELLNCGLGVAFPVGDVAQKIIDSSGKNISINYDSSKPTIKTSLCLDCSKAKKTIGWESKISLEDGIRLTLDWYKDNKI